MMGGKLLKRAGKRNATGNNGGEDTCKRSSLRGFRTDATDKWRTGKISAKRSVEVNAAKGCTRRQIDVMD